MVPSLNSPFEFSTPSVDIFSTPTRRSRQQHSSTPPSVHPYQSRRAPNSFPVGPASSNSPASALTRVNLLPTPVRRYRSVGNKRSRSPSSSSSPAALAAKRSRTRAPLSPSPTASIASESLTPGSPLASPVISSSPLLFRPRQTRSTTMFKTLTDMTFLGPHHPDYLSGDIEVIFTNNGVIDMVGPCITASNYSLSGNVIMEIPALPRGMDSRIRHIEELVIRLEGKSEFHYDNNMYTPLRILEDVFAIVTPEKPVILAAHLSTRAKADRIRIAIPFDMRLPGWLPPTHFSSFTNLSYGGKAEARLGWAPGTMVAQSSVSPRRAVVANTSLDPLTTRVSTSAFTEFTVSRHRFPAQIDEEMSYPSQRTFHLSPKPDSDSPIDCEITLPEWIDINGAERSFKVTIKFRRRRVFKVDRGSSGGSFPIDEDPTAEDPEETVPSAVPMERQETSYGTDSGESVDDEEWDFGTTDAEAPEGEGTSKPMLRLKQLGMEVEEIERFNSFTFASFTSTFPIPEEQPTAESTEYPFLSPCPPYALLGRPEHQPRWRALRRRRCLLSDDDVQRSFIFPDEGLPVKDKYRTINAILPLPKIDANPRKQGGIPQAEMDGAFLRIRQMLVIHILVSDPDSAYPCKVIRLSAPIRFGTSISTVPGVDNSVLLPPYIQVFHENGSVRQCDPLPLYTRTPEPTVAESPTPRSPVPSYKSLFPEATSPASSRSTSPTHMSEPYRTVSTAASSSSSDLAGLEVDTDTAVSATIASTRRTTRSLFSRVFT